MTASNPPGSATAARLLDVAGLTIRADGSSVPLVDGVDLSVAAGETLCVVGESGCGKSLTALALMGLLPTPPLRLAGGRALLDGDDLLTLPPAGLRDRRGGAMAMIFQEPMTSLNPAMRIGDQIAEAVRAHRDVDAAAARAPRAGDAAPRPHPGRRGRGSTPIRTSFRAGCASGR